MSDPGSVSAVPTLAKLLVGLTESLLPTMSHSIFWNSYILLILDTTQNKSENKQMFVMMELFILVIAHT